ncbi:hypothetical protein CC85DRAFT_252949 [Cutaneotrichosporon oleaginosum]|uniref:CRAL/TRIO N-terminal domain-containing protein n=1 Tax=Cutaneotrichosporon oleaginosum TaxID=879819 RepID=A0A0J0XBP2_9TREE|nr:uncharacterized protein CC85DRAFT_252949 [Cutaneotrichosporon oleaginosum]KLT38476.1 hypothetical protein CC85DRAFT_252949 [Cutaneotrichosporon oleaginosum]TXT04007.1 hypothetical protein COLE_07704 [Cutaneotrichosporon oleaginosum]
MLAAPAAPPRPEVTAEQTAALDAFKKHFADYKIECTELGEREKMWLSQETLLRYLRATKGDTDAAIARLEATLAFRRQLNLYDVDATAAIAEKDTRNATRFTAGWNGLRPVNYVFMNRNPLPLEERDMVHNLFLLERMMDLTPAGAQEVCTVFNFGGKQMGPKPGLGQTKEMLGVYDAHYPLQPSLTMLQDMGWAMRAFVNMVWPFIGEAKERTITKTGEQAVAEGLFQADGLIKECGGALDFTYDHATYWPTLLSVSKTRRDAFLENWRKLGAPEVARSEFDWKFV